MTHDQSNPPNEPDLGISGSLTKAFITSTLTPLFLLAALALGLIGSRLSASRGGAADLRSDGRYHGSR
jgi:hypothetical protein